MAKKLEKSILLFLGIWLGLGALTYSQEGQNQFNVIRGTPVEKVAPSGLGSSANKTNANDSLPELGSSSLPQDYQNNRLRPVTGLPVSTQSYDLQHPSILAGEKTNYRGNRFWGRAEVGLWWLRGSNLPPLVTGSPAGTPQTSAGVLGAPGTTILFGNENVNGDMNVGGQFTIGSWLDPNEAWGIEAGLLFIDGQGTPFETGSNGSQIISRPYRKSRTGTGAAELVSFPGLLAGSVNVNAQADPLFGANILLKRALGGGCHRQFYFLTGYRYLRFGEDLHIQENLTSLEPATLGTTIQVNDFFTTRNEFHGGEIGLQAEFWRGNFSLAILGKLAVGNLKRQVIIDGNNTVTSPGGGPSVMNQGGLLALSSNIGNYDSNQVTMVPELGLTGGWQIRPGVRLTMGYSFLWWSDVVRPGDQIDLTVNPNLLPPGAGSGPARPSFTLRESDLWVQGLRFGLEFRY
jgi:hypothetical protein